MTTTYENILIGSDTSASLAHILKSLQEVEYCSFITTTRMSDMIQLINSIHPVLIILSFRDNQHVINSLMHYHKQCTIPMLCLTQPNEYRKLQTLNSNIIFTQSYDHGIKLNNLAINVRGILQMTEKKRNVQTSLPSQSSLQANKQLKDLTRYTLELDQKRAMLDKVKERIKQLYTEVDAATKTQLMTIVNSIKIARNDQKHWDDFKHYFENINPNFLKKLSAQFPCLTEKDLKYCCYLKMNMSNEDIRLMLGINQESVRTHKYRLKKKMVLAKDQNLRNYIQTFVN